MSPTTDIKQEKSPDSLNGQTKLDDTPPGPLPHPSVYTEMQKAATAMAQGQGSLLPHNMMGPQGHGGHSGHSGHGGHGGHGGHSQGMGPMGGLPNGTAGDVGQMLSEYQTL